MNPQKTKVRTLMAAVMALLVGVAQSRFDISLLTDDDSPKKIVLFLDFNFPYTLIQSSNLDCDRLDSCEWINNDRQVGKYMDQEYQYTEAVVTFKFEDNQKSDKGYIKHRRVKVSVRITDHFNVLGINNKTVFPNLLETDHEFVFSLNKKTIKVQKMPFIDSSLNPSQGEVARPVQSKRLFRKQAKPGLPRNGLFVPKCGPVQNHLPQCEPLLPRLSLQKTQLLLRRKRDVLQRMGSLQRANHAR